MPNPRHFAGPVHLLTTHLAPLSWFDSFLGYPPIKALIINVCNIARRDII